MPQDKRSEPDKVIVESSFPDGTNADVELTAGENYFVCTFTDKQLFFRNFSNYSYTFLYIKSFFFSSSPQGSSWGTLTTLPASSCTS